jgi:FkbM family methyltransferase
LANDEIKINFSFKQKIYYLIIFFFNIIKKILKKKRFIPISLPFFLNQIFYDKLNKNFIKFEIRDYIDATMVAQIFYSEDYSLEKFQRNNEVVQYYKNILKQNLKPLIVDCGAHIGLATKYFSLIYPHSKLLCIEPVMSNYNRAKINNLKYENVEFLNKAVGAEDSKGSIYNPKLGNNAYRINKNEEGDINIISVNSILKNLEEDIIPFIIKIDIEGFENELFSKNTEWIDNFPIIIIELHDWMLPKICNSSNFLSSISKKNRDFLYSGENIFSIKNELNKKIQNKINNQAKFNKKK